MTPATPDQREQLAQELEDAARSIRMHDSTEVEAHVMASACDVVLTYRDSVGDVQRNGALVTEIRWTQSFRTIPVRQAEASGTD